MNVGLVVEGEFDDASYRRLLPRVRTDTIVLQVRPCGGKSRLKNKFVELLKELQRNPAWQLDLAFVIRDSDCDPPLPIEKQLRRVLGASGFKPKFRVEFFATPCMLESWLLSDLAAVQKVAARRRHGSVAPLDIQVPNSNSVEDKETFIGVLKHFGLPATPPVYADIAAIADLGLIGDRCTYFREFARRLNLL